VKIRLSSKSDMKDLGATNLILGMKIKRDQENRKVWLNERKLPKVSSRNLVESFVMYLGGFFGTWFLSMVFYFHG
jgi:hypothetical protein